MKTLLLLLCCQLLMAQDPLPWIGSGIRCDEAHPLLRAGLVYRIHLQSDTAVAGLIPPLSLELRLLDTERVLAKVEVNIDAPQQWADGCYLHLVAPRRLPPRSLRLIAVLDDAHGVSRGRLEVAVESMASSQQRLADHIDGPLRQLEDPLPALWLEQAALVATRSRRLADCQQVLELLARIDAYPDSLVACRQRTSFVDAFRATSDQSLQPYRLHRATAADDPALLIWAEELDPSSNKATWPLPDAKALGAALAAGFTVLEVYPAGDRSWNDLAPRRIPQAIAALRQRQPDLAAAPLWLYSSKPPGAALLSAQAWQGRLHGAANDDADIWQQLRAQRSEQTWRTTADRDYAAGPFTLVVGSGESNAAQLSMRENAQRFLKTWAAYSQGDAQWYWDHQAATQALTARNLVLFGNPLSNTYLARLQEQGLDIPLRWDARSISHPASGRSWLRDHCSLVLALPHPFAEGCWVYICDGIDISPLLGDGLPLGRAPQQRLIDEAGHIIDLVAP